MDVSTDRRCHRTDGQGWQCREMASGESSYCEKHHFKYINQKRKRKKSRTSEIGLKVETKKRKKRKRAGLRFGRCGTDDEDEVELNWIMAREQKQQQFSVSKRERLSLDVDKKSSDSGQKTVKSGKGKSNSGEQRSNAGEESIKDKKSSEKQKHDSKGKEEVNDNNEEKGETCKGARRVRQGNRNTRVTESWHLGNGAPKMKFSGNSTKNKEKCLMCHQCQRNDKSGVVFCSNCTKRYCFECIERWYSEKTREEVENACPFCCGSCNCKACLRAFLAVKASPKEVDANVELHRLQYLLYKALPVLKNILMEQNYELEIETRIQGGQFTAADVKRCKLGNDECIYCDNCHTSIFDFHRSCPNASCSYDLCLNCCRDLREGRQPGGDEAETSRQQFVERSNEEAKIIKQRRGSKREIQGAAAANGSKVDSTCHFPDWRANADGSISCPPKDCGGCGMAKLELRCNLKISWVEKHIKSAEELTSTFQLQDVEFSQQCSLCSPNGSKENSEVRQAAFRELSHDNCLYCPSVVDKGDDQIEHFQMHWVKGEPVIETEIIEAATVVSQETEIIEAATVVTEETEIIKAVTVVIEKTEIIEDATVVSQETEIIEAATVVTEVTTSVSSDLPRTIIGPSIVTLANNPLADISLDDLVNNLDNYIDGYLLSPALSSPVINASDVDQIKEVGNHLTELLQLDASSLLLFDNSRLAADFAEKLMYDPLLTDDERSKLTLIMDLPQMSSQWEKLDLEEKSVINFITSMEQKRKDAINLKVDHLKSRDESHALQEDIKKVQTEMSSIEAQITLLQTQLADHEKLLVSKQKSLEEIKKDVDESGSKLWSTVTVLAINQDNIQLQKTRRLTINSVKKGILEVVKPLEKNCF